jgi:hypothetical protein
VVGCESVLKSALTNPNKEFFLNPDTDVNYISTNGFFSKKICREKWTFFV